MVCMPLRFTRQYIGPGTMLQVLAPRGRFSIELYNSYLKLVGQVNALDCVQSSSSSSDHRMPCCQRVACS
jgi:hypothetical protein